MSSAVGTPYLPAATIFEAYVREPGRYWDSGRYSGHHRQARKLEVAAERGAGTFDESGEALRSRVISAALLRADGRPPPIYVMGLGGSGSHWLAAMLADLVPAVNVGEVYVPRLLIDAMRDLSPPEQGFLVDCVHLLHAPTSVLLQPVDHIARARIVNAPFGVIHRRHKDWDPDSFVIHLVRDPRDQVISVTFRKREYRRQIRPDMADEEYLLDRAEVAAANHAGWERARLSPDFTCRYEDLRASPAPVLERLLDDIVTPAESARLARVIREHDASLMRSGSVSRKGNLSSAPSRGWRHDADERVRALLHAKLSEAVAQAGYPPDECLGRSLRLTSTEQARELSFPDEEALGELFTKADCGNDGSWSRLKEARGDVKVPVGCCVKLRVSEQVGREVLMASLSALAPRSLDSLCLAGNAAVDDDLVALIAASLSQLQELDLAYTPISDRAVESLIGTTTLRGASLIGTAISHRTVTSLKHAAPSLVLMV